MELVDRIKVIMKVNQLTAAKLAEEIGVQRSNVSHVLSGRNKPSFEFLHKLLQRYPKVNVQWLITGKSQPPEASPKNTMEDDQSKNRRSAPDDIPESYEEAPEIDRIVIFYRNGTFKTYVSNIAPE